MSQTEKTTTGNQAQTDALDEYRKEFGNNTKPTNDGYPKDTRAAKAYEVALDIRKFEIELFWKRAGYFWLLLAALTTALGLVLTAGTNAVLPMEKRERLALFVACAGAVLSFSWARANAASKQWQRNWEFQVDVLEDIVIGPLYKTVLFKGRDKLPIYHSVSDISIWVSRYFCLIFVAIACYFTGVGRFTEMDWLKLFIVVANVVFVVVMTVWTRRVRTVADLQFPLDYTRRKVFGGKQHVAPKAT